MKIKFFHYNVLVDLAPAKTCWWVSLPASNIFEPKDNQRHDNLLTLQRVYVRGKWKKYVYKICIGRLQILIANTRQK